MFDDLAAGRGSAGSRGSAVSHRSTNRGLAERSPIAESSRQSLIGRIAVSTVIRRSATRLSSKRGPLGRCCGRRDRRGRPDCAKPRCAPSRAQPDVFTHQRVVRRIGDDEVPGHVVGHRPRCWPSDPAGRLDAGGDPRRRHPQPGRRGPASRNRCSRLPGSDSRSALASASTTCSDGEVRTSLLQAGQVVDRDPGKRGQLLAAQPAQRDGAHPPGRPPRPMRVNPGRATVAAFRRTPMPPTRSSVRDRAGRLSWPCQSYENRTPA